MHHAFPWLSEHSQRSPYIIEASSQKELDDFFFLLLAYLVEMFLLVHPAFYIKTLILESDSKNI